MNKEQLKYYLEGIMNMSSSLSDYIGPSYINVECYDKKEFKRDISPTSLSLEEKLREWFCNEEKMIESIIYWINLKIEGKKKILNLEEKININTTLFSFIEDSFILATEKYIILFILGNNE